MNTILSKNTIIDTLKLQLFALFITLILIITFVNIKSKKAQNFFHFGNNFLMMLDKSSDIFSMPFSLK